MAVLSLPQMVRQLRDELARVDYLIRLLESVAVGKNHRGRPPKFPAVPTPSSSHDRRPRKSAPLKRRRPRKASGNASRAR